MPIRCKTAFNISCLKCDIVPKGLVRIGAIYMCEKCFGEEFDVEEIEPSSDAGITPLGKKYYKWLKIYNEKSVI